MKKSMTAALLVSIALGAQAPLAQDTAGAIREGKWSMTMTSTLDNWKGLPKLPAGKGTSESDITVENGKAHIASKIDSQKMSEYSVDDPRLKENAQMHVSSDAKGATVVGTRCVTNSNPLPESTVPEGCDKPKTQRSGNVITYREACDIKDFKMSMDGRIEYSGETMEGVVKTHQTGKGMTIDSTVHIVGKYIGPCDKTP